MGGRAAAPSESGDRPTRSACRAARRPLCDYPKWARYNGSGDINLRASFTCVEHETTPATQRQTAFGLVVGTDNSAASGTYAWKGVPYAKAPMGDLRWKPPVDPDAVDLAEPTQQFGNACVQSGRLYGPGLNNKYDATIGSSLDPDGRLRGLPVSEHLAPGHRGHAAAGDRLGARRQQHLRLHRRSDVRRRQSGPDRQRGRRLGQLPPGRVRLPQHGTAEDRRRARRLRRLRHPRHHQGAAVRQRATSPTSAAIRATSR